MRSWPVIAACDASWRSLKWLKVACQVNNQALTCYCNINAPLVTRTLPSIICSTFSRAVERAAPCWALSRGVAKFRGRFEQVSSLNAQSACNCSTILQLSGQCLLPLPEQDGKTEVEHGRKHNFGQFSSRRTEQLDYIVYSLIRMT